MLNNLVLVGRVVSLPTLHKPLKIAVARSYKNPDTSSYETDFIDITLTNSILENAQNYLSIGDIIGIKGHLEGSTLEPKHNEIKIIVDKLTYLTQSKGEN